MRVAGVWIAEGRLVWVNAGGAGLSLLSTVVVRVGEEEVEGIVHVLPEQWVEAPAEVEGVIARVLPVVEGRDDKFPGADVPPLGGWVRADEVEGRVTAIDVLGRMVTVVRGDGESVTAAVDDVVME